MLLGDYIQRQRIKQIKSKKMQIPTNNINYSDNSQRANLNKLFNIKK